MERECKIHGLTPYRSFKDGTQTKWRCSKCMSFAVSERRRKLKQLSLEYLGEACNDCGYCSNPAALEFHHADPSQKEFGISTSGGTKSFERIKLELDKCLLLCANCHRDEHTRLDAGLYEISPMGKERLDYFYIHAVNS